MSEPLEVERALQALRERVRGSAAPPGVELTPLQKAIAGVNANWHVSAQAPAPANAPFAWRAVHAAKGAARRVMAELLKTIVDQQNAFNVEAARALTELAQENAELRRRVQELEKQVRG